MTDVKDLLQRAMALPPEARAALAGSLLESLDGATDADAETAWSVEIERRMHELDKGGVQPLSWSETRKKLSS
ncbi:MAG: addiction module protein [Planctomycetes bacterium]|nr:addiction module protein [Planctomycetota bacterium]